MKANELRIGNLVNKTEQTIRSSRLGISIWDEYDWYAIGDCIDSLEYYEPIPLTEEWLLKFGFEKINVNERYWVKSVCLIHQRHDEGLDYLPSPFGPVIKYEYVHQLQNLYFALTGEELEYK